MARKLFQIDRILNPKHLPARSRFGEGWDFDIRLPAGRRGFQIFSTPEALFGSGCAGLGIFKETYWGEIER